MRYYIAHARGCSFEFLRKQGFVTFYPTMDDYVFLPTKPENERLLRKQTELCVAFMKKAGQYRTISQKELDAMAGQTVNKISVADRILVVQGFAANLTGVVLEEYGTTLKVDLEGWNRNYTVEIDKMDAVPEPPKEVT